MRNARYIAVVVLWLACAGNALALSFNFTFIDDANGTLATLLFGELGLAKRPALAQVWNFQIVHSCLSRLPAKW
jgi:hypothetical protein